MEYQKAFDQLKEKLLTSTKLYHPIYNLIFFIECDASDFGIGAVLYQEENEFRRTIAYTSRTFRGAERNYSTTEKDALSVVNALSKWRFYLLGAKIIIRTDHQALEYLLTAKSTNPRLTRWAIMIQAYDITIKYLPGKENTVADALSRNPIPKKEELKNEEKEVKYYMLNPIIYQEPSIEKLQEKLQEIYKEIQKVQEEEFSKQINYLKYPRFKNHETIKENELLYLKEGNKQLLIIPYSLQNKYLNLIHQLLLHFGSRKMLHVLEDKIYINQMQIKIKEICKTCELCQKSKHYFKDKNSRMKNIIAKQPLELVAIDIFGPLPKGKGNVQYIFVLVDVFTKFVKFYPIQSSNSKTLLERIKLYIKEVGKPTKILSDHGGQLVSHEFINGLKELGIGKILSSVYHPQSNPSERVQREIVRILRAYCHQKHSLWEKYLALIEKIINNTYHETTKIEPAKLIGKPLEEFCLFPKLNNNITSNNNKEIDREELLAQARINYFHAAKNRKNKHDEKHKIRDFKEGELVLLRNQGLSHEGKGMSKKMMLLYLGPYRIKERKYENAYKLETLEGENAGVHNVIFLRPFLKLLE